MPHAAPPELSTASVRLVISLCGATILLLLDLWLRRREVRDPSLVWLSLSVLSWSASAACQLLPDDWLSMARLRAEYIPYVLSPVSTILFTVAAFRLSRVRELFRRCDLRRWPAAVVITVATISIAAYVAAALGHSQTGTALDAMASCIALTCLALALLYSFHRYGNELLAGLTAVTFTLVIARQFFEAAQGPLQGPLAVLSIASGTTMIMLFIALAVAWGLSDTSRLKPVGVPVNVNVVAMFFDLRGSTQWSMEAVRGDFHYVGVFLDELRGWAWRQAAALPTGRPNLMKFLGDGFLFVWEVPAGDAPLTYATAIVDLACALAEQYPSWALHNRELWRGVPDALGVGVDLGPSIQITFENGSDDYLGAPLNLAARMQDLARPRGGVVIRAEIWDRLDPVLRERFPATGAVRFGPGERIELRATEPVRIAGDPATEPSQALRG